MLFDGYEQYNNDRTDVIVVSRSGSEDEPESEPAANDCTASPYIRAIHNERQKFPAFVICTGSDMLFTRQIRL